MSSCNCGSDHPHCLSRQTVPVTVDLTKKSGHCRLFLELPQRLTLRDYHFRFQMTHDHFHCPRFVDSFDSFVPMGCTSSQNPTCSYLCDHPSCPCQLQHQLCCFTLSMCFSCCTLSTQYAPRCRHLKTMCRTFVFSILSSIVACNADVWGTVRTRMLNDVNVICIYRWSGAFTLMPATGVSKMFVPCMN